MRSWSDTTTLDACAGDDTADDARWRERMADALRPCPLPRPCPDCDGRALGADAHPCGPCGGVGVVL